MASSQQQPPFDEQPAKGGEDTLCLGGGGWHTEVLACEASQVRVLGLSIPPPGQNILLLSGNLSLSSVALNFLLDNI